MFLEVLGDEGGDEGGEVDVTRQALRRVLHAFVRHDAATGYVQGMDAIAAAVMVPSARAPGASASASEGAAFWWLVHVTSSPTLLGGYFSHGMHALCVELDVLQTALTQLSPPLVAHIEQVGLD